MVMRSGTARLLLAACSTLTLVACGKRGNPVPPQVRVPRAVTDLKATARAAPIADC